MNKKENNPQTKNRIYILGLLYSENNSNKSVGRPTLDVHVRKKLCPYIQTEWVYVCFKS